MSDPRGGGNGPLGYAYDTYHGGATRYIGVRDGHAIYFLSPPPILLEPLSISNDEGGTIPSAGVYV